MKYIIIAISFAFSISNIIPQDSSLQWFTNLEEAQVYSKKNNKQILMVFAGSDWCRPCMQFKKDILESSDFSNQVENQLVVLYLDFPARKKNRLSKEQTQHNEALAERFNPSGAFPHIVLIDSEQNILANPSYEKQSVNNFIQKIKVGK